ncbi:MAG TPA: monooxygenase [Candidatus Corynebacterium avicola]|uniref:Monooxygenase n=1 Tax=Candidatus Corynebacterium avicola TaxID=2838527 RepID=A0A9D1UK32_9CORY|nr:monooxygenase [Candidatus Corynebacterium avicola]
MTTHQESPQTPPLRSVAVIGAGIAGANAALAFTRKGWRVDLYSNRNRNDLRNNSPATGTAILFGASRTPDAEITTDRYADVPTAHFTSSAASVSGVTTFASDLDYEAQSVDVRLRADDRIGEFLELAESDNGDTTGGQFIVQDVTTDSLDTIAAEHDLTFVATGKAGLADLFETDEERTPYTEPQRYLITVTTHGLPSDHVFAGRNTKPGSLLSIHDEGEVFVGPYLHKDWNGETDGTANTDGDSWVLLAWARPGTDTEEAFRSAENAQDALDVLKKVHRDNFPEVADDIDQLTTIDSDRYSWLKGAVTPRVHKPTATTAGGHLIATLGDTSIAVDPIAGQGAQLSTFQIAALAQGLQDAETDGRDWDADLLTELFDQHWEAHGASGVEVTTLFLADPKFADVANEFFGTAAGDPEVARTLFSLFSETAPALTLRTAEDVQNLVASRREKAETAESEKAGARV